MKMPGISIVEFLAETKDDFNSPTTSTFTSKMAMCRSTISALEESLDADRSALKKMKNAVKAMYNSGSAHCTNEEAIIENLERLGSQAFNAREPEPDIGSVFLKLAVFTKELTSLLKNLVTNINNIVMFPLESLLKGDLKGIKGDIKRPFDKSWKDYDTKVKQVEREKRQIAKEAGMIRNEITGGEIAEEMEKERRMFQLQMCEYLIKANEIKTKKGVDLLQHLMDYYHAQDTFFSEGCRVTENFKSYATELSSNLHSIRLSQDEERRQLVELRSLLRSAVGETNTSKSGQSVYNLHQLQGLKEFGNEKVGFLMKRSEGLRKAWQKRKCTVSDGYLTISHNNISKAPVKLNLLTSQVKPVLEDKKIFDLVSHNRTYRFMADDEAEAMVWVSVISNSKEDALNRVFGEEGGTKEQNSGLKELTKSILDEVKHLPGNDRCCDCGTQDPTWLSTNLGVLTCIECSGIHRDMGVHISRIQSITLDELGTSELLLARAVGNAGFNDIMEANMNFADKPKPSSDMEIRKTFIREKYEMHRYATHICLDDPGRLQEELLQAVQLKDIYALLQVFAEGADLSAPLPGFVNGETALHLAIRQEDRSTLAIVDFLVQNSSQSLNKQTSNDGNTPLHLCAELNKTECMKLLLRTRAKTDIKNLAGEGAIDVAKRMGNTSCEELLAQALSGKFHPIVHVDVDWNFSFVEEDDDEFDFPPDNSDDELEEKSEKSATLGSHYNSPYKPVPVPSARNRPVSAINPGMAVTPHSSTPESIGRLRPTSFKDRPRPTVPLMNHGVSPSAPLPPPRPEKGLGLASANVSNISRNRSRTVAPVSSLKEHKRTNSDTRPANAPANLRNISNALETILQNRGAPPPLPPHHSQPSGTNRPSQPLPHVQMQEPTRKDSFGNESGSKAGSQPPSKPRNQPHHSFSFISSIQNALKSQSKNSRRSLDAPFKTSSGAGNPATLPAGASMNAVTKAAKSNDKKRKRRSGNFTLAFSTASQPLGRSLESLLLTSKPPSSDDTHDLSFQSLCTLPRSTPAPQHAIKVISPHSPPVTPYTNSYNFDVKTAQPVYANSDAGIYDNASPELVASLRNAITADPSPGTHPVIPPSHSQSFSDGRSRTLSPKQQPKDRDGATLGVESQSFHFASSYNQSLFNPVPSRPQPKPIVQPPGPNPPALPDKLATRELPPPPLPRSSGSGGSRPQRVQRVRAIYDCEADNRDELTFVENEIIVVTGEEDPEWWVGHIEHQPHRSGVFPVSFVHYLSD